MYIEAQRLLELLIEEKDAARRADIDRLVSLQEEKQAAFACIDASQIPDDLRTELTSAARANIGLMRHLSHCLHGILTGGAPQGYYTANGAVVHQPAAQIRGTL